MFAKVQDVESMLVGKFASLPIWARLITYFVMLALYVYLTLTPSFIWGECLIQEADGSVTPFRGGGVHCIIEGRTIKGQINEEGVWSVPVVSKLPSAIEVYFLSERRQYPLTFKTSIWSQTKHKVYFHENPTGFSIAEVQSSSPLHLLAEFFQGVLRSLSVPEAFAQKKPVVKKTPVPFKKMTAPKMAVIADPIADRVRITIARNLGVDASQITPTTSLLRGADITQLKRIRLVTDLQKEFDVRITDEEWNLAYTTADATELVRRKLREGR